MIIDQNEHFWVLNKPAGEVINNDGSAPGFISKFQDQVSSKAHPVHRLDKDTSGLLLVAKNKEANRILSRAFQDKRIKKYYLAVTRSKPGVTPKKKQGWIKGDMEKSRGGSWKLLKSGDNPAETYFQSVGLGDRRRLCLVQPVTGKTHQIRVAMRSISMPILGDERYGVESSDRMYLHAAKIHFELFNRAFTYSVLPDTGTFFSAIDERILALLEA